MRVIWTEIIIFNHCIRLHFVNAKYDLLLFFDLNLGWIMYWTFLHKIHPWFRDFKKHKLAVVRIVQNIYYMQTLFPFVCRICKIIEVNIVCPASPGSPLTKAWKYLLMYRVLCRCGKLALSSCNFFFLYALLSMLSYKCTVLMHKGSCWVQKQSFVFKLTDINMLFPLKDVQVLWLVLWMRNVFGIML